MPLLTHKVTICGIPELSLHCSVGVSHVLSIIDTHEPRPPALDHYSAIEHELIRFDDVVAEYPGFEACTPAHIAKVLQFGERVHARPDSHVLVHCHAGISRSTAAAAILMCQHAPGQEEAAFLKLLGMRKHAARSFGLPPRPPAGEAAPERGDPQHRPRPRAACVTLTRLKLLSPARGP
jgi:predicted protein tyrosine phosphatase